MSSDSSGAESDEEDVPLRVLASRSGVAPRTSVFALRVPESSLSGSSLGEIAAAAEDDASIARVAQQRPPRRPAR